VAAVAKFVFQEGVIWRAGQFGYSVEVYRRGELVGAERCGNHAYDPAVSVPAGSPEALSTDDLRQFARKLALEMAEAYGISPSLVVADDEGASS